MVSTDDFRKLALAFPGTTEQPHFDKTSFRAGKKIFATLDKQKALACVRLSEIDQNVFSTYDTSIFFPVPNQWGKQGWTFIDLKKVKKSMLSDALQQAYEEILPSRLKKR